MLEVSRIFNIAFLPAICPTFIQLLEVEFLVYQMLVTLPRGATGFAAMVVCQGHVYMHGHGLHYHSRWFLGTKAAQKILINEKFLQDHRASRPEQILWHLQEYILEAPMKIKAIS